ncbi:MAG: tetratricopeptide repeat protein [Candidatus Peregrinibacteria bacterium]
MNQSNTQKGLFNKQNNYILNFPPANLVREVAGKQWDIIAQNPEKSAILKGLFGENYREEIERDPSLQFAEKLEIFIKEIKEKEALLQEIERLKSENTNTDYEILLNLAEEALNKNDFEQYHKILEEYGMDQEKKLAEIAYLRGKEYFSRLQYDDARKQYEKAINLDKENNRYWNDYGMLFQDRGNYEKAIKVFEKVLKMSEKSCNKDCCSLSVYYNNLGMAYKTKGENDKAIEYLKKALQINKEFHNDNCINLSSYYNNIGTVYTSKNMYYEAMVCIEKALQIDKESYGESHSKIAIRYNNLGVIYDLLGEHYEAIKYYKKALKIEKNTFRENYPSTATTYKNLGDVYKTLKDYIKAIEFYEQALKIEQKIFGKKHPRSLLTNEDLNKLKNKNIKTFL